MKVMKQIVVSTSSIWVMKIMRQITVSTSIAWVMEATRQILQLHSSLQVLLKRKKRKENFVLFSDQNGSLLRRQPRAMTIGHSPTGALMSLHS